MYFLLSGEGPTDLGTSTDNQPASGRSDPHVGPLSLLIDQIVERKHNYHPLESMCIEIIPKNALTAKEKLEKSKYPKRIGLPGKRVEKETRYFFNNARMLAQIALDRKDSRKEEVVAVLFRDADGTASSDRGERDLKRESILSGFKYENFNKGVAMVPKPKSEAWILCAMRKPEYKNCESLEEESGNDDSPNSLKNILAKLNGGTKPDRNKYCEWVLEGKINPDKISMPSFDQFKSDFLEAIQ